MDYRVESVERKFGILAVVRLRVIRSHLRMQGKMAFDRAGHHGVVMNQLELKRGDLVQYTCLGKVPHFVGDVIQATDPCLKEKTLAWR